MKTFILALLFSFVSLTPALASETEQGSDSATAMCVCSYTCMVEMAGQTIPNYNNAYGSTCGEAQQSARASCSGWRDVRMYISQISCY